MKNKYIQPFLHSRKSHDIQYKSGVYILVNTTNGRFYVGSSIDLPSRKRLHFGTLRRNCNVNKNLQADYNLHGKEVFSFEPIEEVQYEDQLKVREQYWLDKYATENKHLLYNRSLNAESILGVKMSEECKEKHKTAHLGEKNGMFGKRVKECKYGHPRSPETLNGSNCKLCAKEYYLKHKEKYKEYYKTYWERRKNAEMN
jgi:group I intron endonuclease